VVAAGVSSDDARPSDSGEWLDWIDQDKYAPRPNAQPGAWLPVMRLRGGSSSAASDAAQQRTVVLQTMKWGLYPHYKEEPPGSGAHFQMFNARCEDGVKSQKRLVGRKQCVIISSGFYEFKEVAGRAPGVFTGPKSHKQGYYVHFKGSSTPMYFAGLYDTWRHKDDPENPLYTCTILTTEPSEKLRWLHNRMPVILDTNQKVQQWLSATAADGASIAALSKLYVGCASPELAWYPVTREINSARYQGPDCTAELSLGGKNTVQNFFKPMRVHKSAQKQGETAASVTNEEVSKPAAAAVVEQGKEKAPVGSTGSQLVLRPCGQLLCASDAPVFISIPSASDGNITTSKTCKCPLEPVEFTCRFDDTD
jgi:putative SOS response-associated peptidase YedK